MENNIPIKRTSLSKVLTVSSKYQITVPEHVRDIMKIKANDAVIFTTDGENVFFEKFVQQEENHLRLVTYARMLLNTGAPIYITGDVRKGKTKLGKEIGTYGFEEVVYINPEEERDFQNLIEKFNYALNSFGNTQQLLIIDEYTFLARNKILQLGQDFFENYKGSLIVISQTREIMSIPPNYTHPTHYWIRVKDMVVGAAYEVVHYIADNSKPLSNKVFEVDIKTSLNLPEAITTWGAIQYLRHFNENSTEEAFFVAQKRAAINYLEKHLYGNGIFLVSDLEKRINAVKENVTEETQALGKYVAGLNMILKQYLTNNAIEPNMIKINTD